MTAAHTIVGLGESLFDVFPHEAILGGAPLNVAYHAHQLCSRFGGHGVVASGIGNDELGQRLLAEMSSRGLTDEFVQRDPIHPTGRVDITLKNGEPTYSFLEDTAWDHLQWTSDWRRLAAECSAVVFGTLAQRSAVSRATVRAFVDSAPQAFRLFDVNLRVNFFDVDSIRHGIGAADAVKLNEVELPVVLQLLGLGDRNELSPTNAGESPHDAERILAQFAGSRLRFVVVTRGERGTELLTRDRRVVGQMSEFARQSIADNVGAGDACSAGLLWGWLNSWSLEETVTFANRLGAFVASQPGATPMMPVEVIEL